MGTALSAGPTQAQVAAALAGATVPGGLSLSSSLTTGGSVDVFGGPVDVETASFGVQVKEGANAKQGVATLAAGTVTVANTSVTASSRIILTAQLLGGVATPWALAVTARTAGTSFTITSASAADTSTVAWEIFEPG
jgi:hypothetical protein